MKKILKNFLNSFFEGITFNLDFTESELENLEQELNLFFLSKERF